jgi:hypothetical protein
MFLARVYRTILENPAEYAKFTEAQCVHTKRE